MLIPQSELTMTVNWNTYDAHFRFEMHEYLLFLNLFMQKWHVPQTAMFSMPHNESRQYLCNFENFYF